MLLLWSSTIRGAITASIDFLADLSGFGCKSQVDKLISKSPDSFILLLVCLAL